MLKKNVKNNVEESVIVIGSNENQLMMLGLGFEMENRFYELSCQVIRAGFCK